MMKNKSLLLSAHAKINLHLNIGPRREDGYHDLQTIFQEISLHDTLVLKKTTGDFHFTLTNETSVDLSANSDNLVMKALQLLNSKLNSNEGIDAHLIKRIPIGAGLGGGSSDAAAALRGGYTLWGKASEKGKKIPSWLRAMATQLGADVPFFLEGGTAWAEGIGEKLKALPKYPKQWLILVYPKIHVSTPLAYKLLDEARSSGLKPQSFSPRKKMLPFYNSFEPVIDAQYPTLPFVKEALRAVGCKKVLMSGSGSSIFGFIDTKEQGQRALKKMGTHNWDVFLTHTI